MLKVCFAVSEKLEFGTRRGKQSTMESMGKRIACHDPLLSGIQPHKCVAQIRSRCPASLHVELMTPANWELWWKGRDIDHMTVGSDSDDYATRAYQGLFILSTIQPLQNEHRTVCMVFFLISWLGFNILTGPGLWKATRFEICQFRRGRMRKCRW